MDMYMYVFNELYQFFWHKYNSNAIYLHNTKQTITGIKFNFSIRHNCIPFLNQLKRIIVRKAPL